MSDRITVGADSLLSEIGDRSTRVIDVRRAEDYKKDHIPTAVNLPLADLLSDDSPGRVQALASKMGIGDQTPVVVYDSTFGALASRVAWALEHIGHSDVSLLDITYDRWKEMDLERDDKTPEVQAKDHSLAANPGIMATADYLEGHKDGITLIDNRERLNYLEQHIPGSINIPYRMLASPERILRPKEDMKKLFETRQIQRDAQIVTYCGSVGTLSGLAYYALKSAGIPDVKLYVRSFKEWKSLKKPTSTQEYANYWDLSAE